LPIQKDERYGIMTFTLECGHRIDAKDYPGEPRYVYCHECRAFRWVKEAHGRKAAGRRFSEPRPS
jgi:hypothetical protein